MSMDTQTFGKRCLHIMESFPAYANAGAEINAIAAALSSDATTRDTTVQTAPVGLKPGSRANTPFTNAILLEVNKGKAGNLSNAAMSQVLQAASGPINMTAPMMSLVTGTAGTVGAIYTASTGTWQPPGATFTRQWMRNGMFNGSTGTTYTIVAADEGTTVACLIHATNSQGTNSMPTNGVAIPAP